MLEIIEKSLSNSFNYAEYRNHATNLILAEQVTGNEQSEDLLHYAQLNEVRMNRLEKTIQITEEVKNVIADIKKEQIWLVITESWCGDAAQILPIIYKMSQLSESVYMRIVLRDDNEDLMNKFLTNGGKAIPKLVFVEKESMEVLGDFGPRPTAATKLVSDYKAEFGIIDATIKSNLQKWYLQDKGISTQNEIAAFLKSRIKF
jgi:hypothetical protein